MGIGRGKLLLFGEHAAVYGHPALGLATADHTRVTASAVEPESSPMGVVRVGNTKLPLIIRGVEDAYINVLYTAVERTIETARISFRELEAFSAGLQLTIESTIPTASGFGSSAALCVALARELVASGRSGFTETWQIANEVERIFHGTPSGIDTGLSLSNGLQALYPGPPALPTRQPVSSGSFALVYGGVPRVGDTRSLVAHVRQGMEASRSETVAAVDALGAIARTALSVCVTDAPAAQLGSLCSEAQAHLRSLALSTDELEQRIETARRSGALGGKLSGAGGGGAWFAVYETPEAAREGFLHVRREIPASERSLLRVLAVSGSDVRTIE